MNDMIAITVHLGYATMRYIVVFSLLFLSQLKVTSQSLPLEPITADNAAELQEVHRLGRGTANALDWHPNGEQLAIGSATGVWLLDETMEAIEQTPIDQNIAALAWSSDGQYIAVTSNIAFRCGVQVWNADFSEPRFNSDFCGSEIRWSSDNIHLAVFNFTPYTNEVQLIDLSRNEATILPGQDGVWSPSGDVLFTRLGYTFTNNDPPTLYTWNASTESNYMH